MTHDNETSPFVSEHVTQAFIPGRCIDCGYPNNQDHALEGHPFRPIEAEYADLVEQEYQSYVRSADWELRNITKALNLLPFLNGPVEEARLEAVKRIQSERRQRRSPR